MGESLNLTTSESRKIVYKILTEENDNEFIDSLKNLLEEIESVEPFDKMPNEVKPSLIKLDKIINESKEDINKYILTPIIETLNKYVEQKLEQEKLKKQTKIAYYFTIISFVIGAIGLYFTFVSPNVKDIAKEIKILEKQEEAKVKSQ